MDSTKDGAPEEAEINAYMEADYRLPEERQIAYLKQRHTEIALEYENLKLQKSECEGRKYEDGLRRLQQIFRDNYIARKVVVTELRKLGEPVADPFVPLSKV